VPRWLTRALARIHAAAATGMVRLTNKAASEAKTLGMAPSDVVDVVAALEMPDFAERIVSDDNGDWMYVFLVEIEGLTVYVKVVLRTKCFVVSFHEDETSKAHA
jgi:hypothetical protein